MGTKNWKTCDVPATARSRLAPLDAVRDTGIESRAGVHTGEVEIIGSDVGGVAVHAAARIMGLAGPSEVYASSVTVGLADGSDLAFDARGPQQVKGLARPIEIFSMRRPT